MERRQTKTYRVIHLLDGRVFDYQRAIDVAEHVFIFGNFDLPSTAIYKSETRWKWRGGGEVKEFAKRLEKWEP